MKNITKLLIAATICVLSGVVFIGIALGMVNFDIRQLGTREVKHNVVYECDEDVDKIVIDDSNTAISIRSSEVDKVTLSYWENDKETYNTALSAGVLTCIKEENYLWYERIMVMEFGEYSMEITVPEDYSGELQLETSNGRIELKDIKASTASVDTGNGKIVAEDVTIDEKISFSDSNGSITLDNVKAEEISADSSNAAIRFTDVEAKEMKLHTSNGTMELKNVNPTESIECDNSNGAIRGSIKGAQKDFTISADTSNGKCNLPENSQGGDKDMRMQTSNATIEIEFVE